MAPEAVRRFKTKIRHLTRRNRGQSLRSRIADLNRYLPGWLAYFRLAELSGMFRNLDGWIRRRLRAYLWAQWPRVRTRLRALRALGAPAGPWHRLLRRAGIRLPSRVYLLPRKAADCSGVGKPYRVTRGCVAVGQTPHRWVHAQPLSVRRPAQPARSGEATGLAPCPAAAPPGIQREKPVAHIKSRRPGQRIHHDADRRDHIR